MIFELALERVRRQFGLCVYGYVVMPEHVHLLVSEPAGAIRIGNAVGAAFTSRRVFEPVEAQILFTSGALLVILSVLFAFRPKVPAYALVVLLSWIGLALLYRGYRLYREGKRSK